jgi:hypothetical protein
MWEGVILMVVWCEKCSDKKGLRVHQSARDALRGHMDWLASNDVCVDVIEVP